MKRPQFAADVILTLGLMLGASGSAFAAIETFSTFPATPQANLDFVLRVPEVASCGAFISSRADVSGNAITLTYVNSGACFPELLDRFPVGAAVRVPAPGTYRVFLRGQAGNFVGDAQDLGSITVAAGAAATRAAPSLAGIWLSPSQPGWGLTIAEGESGQAFLVWYTYAMDQPNAYPVRSSWYFMPSSQWSGPNQLTAPVYSAAGPTVASAFNPSRVRTNAVGIATVTVQGPDAITFAVQGHDGGPLNVSQSLTRFRF